MANISKENVIINFFWRFLERTGAQIVQFVVSIVLARILLPEVYGQVALITIFINILNVFVDSGMGSALIQKKNADQIDFSTVFYFNIVVCVALYVLVFFCAPFISAFYKNADLVGVIRVLSIVILISGMKNIQQAYVSRNMMFKKFFFSTIGGTVSSAIVGIILASRGFGVWALVAQQLTNNAVDTIVIWLTVNWRPTKEFSFARLKVLYSFGWKMLASSLIDTLFNNIRQLVIGRIYTSSDLAYYNRGKQFPDVIVTNINSGIDSVLLPSLSQEQDDTEKVKNMTRRAIKISTYLIAPTMLGLACCAPSIVKLILTEKWLQCIPYMRVFCVALMFYPIHTANLNAIKAKGRSDLFLRLEVVKNFIGIILLLVSMKYGVFAIAMSMLVSSVCSQIINAMPNKKLLNYGYLSQLKDILPNILAALAMACIVMFVSKIKFPLLLSLLAQIVAGIISYWFLSKIFKVDSYLYLKEILKYFYNKYKQHF